MTTLPRWLGLDLGGSSIKVAVIEAAPGDAGAPQPGGAAAPRLVSSSSHPAHTADGPDVVVANLVAAGRAALAAHRSSAHEGAAGTIAGVGVGLPGLFDADAGTVELLPNLPGAWRGRPVRAEVAAALELPVALINDARAFTLAESQLGAAAGFADVIAYVIGTGIGGGVVVDGHLRFGPHGRAGELGHVSIDPAGRPCGCGNRGCLDALASATAIVATSGQPTVEAAFAAAVAGDARATAAIDTAIDHLGRGIAGMVTALWPQRIVVGGGVAGAGPALFGRLRTAIERHAPLVDPAHYELVPAALDAYAGAIGAALWSAQSSPP